MGEKNTSITSKTHFAGLVLCLKPENDFPKQIPDKNKKVPEVLVNQIKDNILFIARNIYICISQCIHHKVGLKITLQK